MKNVFIIFTSLLTILCLNAQEENKPLERKEENKNEVILLPTIHGNHKKPNEFYNLEHLTWVVKDLKADIFCSEITATALAKYRKGKVDRRIAYLPEYSEVILKLEKELDYTVFGCSAWTTKTNFKTIGVKAMSNAHYKNVAKVLDQHAYQQKRIVVSFGSGHINELLNNLRKRDDIKITDYRPELAKQKLKQLESK